jgi:hypothetical protein
MKTITIRLSGAAASLSGTRSFALTLEDNATYADVIRSMGQTHPALIGLVIAQDGQTMLSSNFFQLSEQDFILHGMWELAPKNGAVLTLISPITGG